MTTADILAHCRSKDSAGDAQNAAQPVAGDAETATKPAEAGKPTSTKDILAAASATAGEAKPAAQKSPTQPAAAEPAGKKPAAKAKPTSTKDILAAARAASAQGGADKAGVDTPKPMAAKAKKGTPPTAPSGEKPSVKEMLAAFRSDREASGQTAAKPAAAGGPPKLPIPPRKAKAKPVLAAVDGDRRGFLMALCVMPSALNAAWMMLAGSTVAWTMAMARFALPNVLVEPPSKFKIGSPADYDFGTVSTKWKALRGIWVVHTDRYEGKNVIVALSTICTHLGCKPNWLESEQKFKCPCHGSGFYIDGINFEGPAPRPLERHGISVAADGMLEVDKSLKFQEEMGQWEDPKSFVAV